MKEAHVVPGEREEDREVWLQVSAELPTTHAHMAQFSGPLSAPCKGKGVVGAQRALLVSCGLS